MLLKINVLKGKAYYNIINKENIIGKLSNILRIIYKTCSL